MRISHKRLTIWKTAFAVLLPIYGHKCWEKSSKIGRPDWTTSEPAVAVLCQKYLKCQHSPASHKSVWRESSSGWLAPDVDPRDEDQVARFKKKIQKDENFVSSIKLLSDLVENFIMENNSVDIYEEYFADESFKQDQGAEFKTLSVYRICRSLFDKATRALPCPGRRRICLVSLNHFHDLAMTLPTTHQPCPLQFFQFARIPVFG
ncbi:dynein intermediate chain 2, axonemal [Trichonephila clavipes]|nr:dynein intermediate chain 2, axonemal [Trichonephila clavipes]